MSSDPLYDAFARMLSRADNGPGRAPRAHPSLMMLGTVVTPDPYQSTMSLDVGGGLVIPDLSYLQHYGPDNMPRSGEPALLSMTGAGAVVLGRFVGPGQTGAVLT